MIKFGWIFITNQPILIGVFLFLLTTKTLQKNIHFTLACRICTIVENTGAKVNCVQELRTTKTISNDYSLPFITTYNPIVYEMIGKSVECLKRNKVDGFENLTVIKSKRQAPNLKKIITKAEFFQKQAGVYKCPDK